MENRDRQILTRILDEINIVSGLVSNIDYAAFMDDEKTKRAVCMTLINIGELVKALSEPFKQAHADIPWRAISGLRDIAAHHYQTLRMEDIWITVQDDIPILKGQAGKLL
ncbi:MAG: DUF86 domain-containing protein [Oscillospiraceae bacterium]|jgi:uncharacterized protein with HEPN domain|nr:DUF86 domain-containing protein [Oscillospiraceae bacterium]